MEQRAQAIDHTLAEPQSDLTAQQSLDRIVRLLIVVRYIFVIVGLAFLVWKISEVSSEGKGIGFGSALEIGVASVLAPLLVWFGSKFAEGLAKQVSQAQNRLLAANQVAQRGITEREEAEEALKRNEETARRLADESVALAEIGRIIGSSLNIDDVYERFAEEVRILVPFDRIVINLVDLENGVFRNAYLMGIDVPNRRLKDVTALTGTITGEVVQTRRGVLAHPDKEQILTKFPAMVYTIEAGIRSCVSAPLISDDRIIGALHLQSSVPNAYTEIHLALTEHIATQIAGAIANSKLHSDILKTEEALSQSEQRYRHMIEEASDMVYSVDAQGYFTYVNPVGLKITGYPENEIIGSHFTYAVTPDWKERVRQFYSSQIDNQELETLLEFPIVTRSGEVKWIEQTATLLCADGKVTGFQVIGRDVTKRKQIEEERERLIAKLQEAAAKIKTMSGLLPICASCKKIRDDTGYWNQIEEYIQVHSDAEFSHSICPDCVIKLYPDIHLKSRSTTG